MRDELLQTAKRLHSEHGIVREERDRAVRERDEVYQVINSLRTDLEATVTRRLEAESISVGLGKELAEVREVLQAESDEHDLLCTAVGVVSDDLGVAQSEGTSSLAVHAARIAAWVGQLEEDAFHAGITQAFTVAPFIMIGRSTWR